MTSDAKLIKSPRDLVISAGYNSYYDFTQKTGIPYQLIMQLWGRKNRPETLAKYAEVLNLDTLTLEEVLLG